MPIAASIILIYGFNSKGSEDMAIESRLLKLMLVSIVIEKF